LTELQLAVLFIFVLLLLLGTGVWIGLALLGVAYFGMELFTGRPPGEAMVTSIWRISSSWSLTALPLFIWMGEVLYRTRLADDMLKGIAPWVARLPGGLLHFNVVGCAVFAAVSGSSVATLATVGRMSIPELRQRRYPEQMVIGTLAGAATLGLLIPPSLILIVYGVTVNASISKLFIAGIIPGLVLAALFMGYIAAWSVIRKHSLPPAEPRVSLREKLRRTRSLLPILLLILLVIGSMYVGLATATEAAAWACSAPLFSLLLRAR
jgi:tripartite ATP-independent transporter DctM subunit